TAFTVIVVDTLSEHLNPTSLVMGSSSHDYTWTLEGERTLKVTYNNIMLPDSNVNEPASNGYFYFTIDAQDSLDFGTEIENEADIYFDFNDPIRTNKTFHLVSKLKEKTTSISSAERPQELLRIYPQPASAEITVVTLSGADLRGNYLLYTSDGRLLGGGSAIGPRKRISVESLAPGIYTFVLRDQQGRLVSSQRFVIGK
ncbi:MAG: T9SS type A sorting domain-containing protein, partial [Bacteroidota bacterium]